MLLKSSSACCHLHDLVTIVLVSSANGVGGRHWNGLAVRSFFRPSVVRLRLAWLAFRHALQSSYRFLASNWLGRFLAFTEKKRQLNWAKNLVDELIAPQAWLTFRHDFSPWFHVVSWHFTGRAFADKPQIWWAQICWASLLWDSKDLNAFGHAPSLSLVDQFPHIHGQTADRIELKHCGWAHIGISQAWVTFDHTLVNSHCFLASLMVVLFLQIFRQTTDQIAQL